MWPLLLPLLKDVIAPGAISLLSNRIGSGASYGRMKDLQRKLMDLYSPERLTAETGSLFRSFQASPMYTGLQTRAMTGASSLGNQLARSFAMRGLSNTGLAGAAEPLARGSFQQGFNEIDANLWGDALKMARENLQSQAGVLQGFNPVGIGAGTAGGTIKDMLPLIYAWLQKQNYGMGGRLRDASTAALRMVP